MGEGLDLATIIDDDDVYAATLSGIKESLSKAFKYL
jgi:hypothetical protein